MSGESTKQNSGSVSGCVTFVSPTKISAKANPYFDVYVKTSPSESKKIRVMSTSSMKRNLFTEKEESKEPVRLIGLSPTKSNMFFFNSNTGGQVEENKDVTFQYLDLSDLTIKHVLEHGISGTFTLQGKIKWIQEERVVLVGQGKTKKFVRDGIMADESSHIAITVWSPLIDIVEQDVSLSVSDLVLQSKYGMKLSTTTSTEIKETDEIIEVDWAKIPIIKDLMPSKICCLEILSLKEDGYKSCVNNSCLKKVTPFPGESLVKCFSCGWKMKVTRCTDTFTVEHLWNQKANKLL
ncbi:uncharacterized protein LOC130625681 [Hydractinia symbiolongicarpus]|uniref:uncharacterized protein LOC130625681 n=1 Tax=Hydractinia symbiolongicarpus TaxID=13093 RepID=UPI00255075D4|nr:uncharacterized protein LOC130625681 [Hydractinia symbiolongicarpus]XP_057296766.1 uncharacterized protein LOC130625681 [Hydractinia symbiolongicarpus]